MNDFIKILQINTCNFGSTGNIMLNISRIAQEHGNLSYVAYANSRSSKKKDVNNSILIGSILERNLHLQLSKYTGLNGCFSIFGTKRFLRKVDEIKPDVIHLHNLHNGYINLKMLFSYIKEKDIPVVWTLHDCWAFTGQCPHFMMSKCQKWKTGCFECSQYRDYPSSMVDRTKKMYALKKTWFTGVNNLTIITPSQWLANLVSESFLKKYEVRVLNNGIDLKEFKPTKGEFLEKYNIQNKFIILGVANPWSEKKGLCTFVQLSKRVDQSHKIIMVGLTKDQIRELPQNILGLPKTNNTKELAEIYSAASVFLNPTLEDNFPTTNLESIACGTPVITFNTGGSVEVINKYTGKIIEKNELEELLIEINCIRNEGKEKYFKERLVEAKRYNENNKFDMYIDLYQEIIRKR